MPSPGSEHFVGADYTTEEEGTDIESVSTFVLSRSHLMTAGLTLPWSDRAKCQIRLSAHNSARCCVEPGVFYYFCYTAMLAMIDSHHRHARFQLCQLALASTLSHILTWAFAASALTTTHSGPWPWMTASQTLSQIHCSVRGPSRARRASRYRRRNEGCVVDTRT